MKKLISLALAAVMLLAIVPFSVAAETYSGECGDNLTWTLDTSTGVLTISGTGAMYDYYETYEANETSYDAPWYNYRSYIKSVVVEEGVTDIGDNAFKDCTSLTSITIPDSVTSVGMSAFKDCTSLTSITIPDSVTSIDKFSFYDCSSLTSVTIPNGVTSIGECTFFRCKSLTSITIPDSVTEIGQQAFYCCESLTSITIPDSVTSIGGAFYGCTSLTSIIIPDSVTSIGIATFDGCTSLTSITIPDSVTSIGRSAFWGCTSLTSVTIPDSVTSIGEYAFRDCTSLTSITIPDSVTSVGEYAFSFCTSMTDIYCEAVSKPAGWDSAWISDCDATVHWNYIVAVVEAVIENAILAGTEINVKKVDDEDKLSVFEIITEDGINKEKAELFDIELIYGGEVIQPNGNVKVSITAPEGINVEQVKVYHVSDDGTLTDMNAVYEDGKFVFFTDHFSYYLIAEVLVGFENKTIALGDINMDGMVNQYDYILAKRAHFNTIELTDAQKLAGDMDENGKNNQYDYILVKRIHFKNYSTDKTVEIVVE